MTNTSVRFALAAVAASLLSTSVLLAPAHAQTAQASTEPATAVSLSETGSSSLPAAGTALDAKPPASTFEKAREAENVCLVRKAYTVSAAKPHHGIKDAVDYCVTFEKGLAGWYREEQGRRGNVFAETDPTSKKTLVTLQAMAQAYLETYLPRCEAAKESVQTCLQRLKLPAE